MDEAARADDWSAGASRPRMPESYGIRDEAEGRGLLPWSHVAGRMQSAHNYWIATAGADGRPHVAPIWGLWQDAAFYFSTDPTSRKGRNLAANPSVVIHLESGDDAVILEGPADRFEDPRRMQDLDKAYFEKYGYHLIGNSVYRVRPSRAFAWFEADFPGSATRWESLP